MKIIGKIRLENVKEVTIIAFVDEILILSFFFLIYYLLLFLIFFSIKSGQDIKFNKCTDRTSDENPLTFFHMVLLSHDRTSDAKSNWSPGSIFHFRGTCKVLRFLDCLIKIL